MKKLLLCLISLLAAWIVLSIIMLWPPISPYWGQSGYACVTNLRQIEGAKEQHILETGRTNGPIDPAAVAKYLKGGREPRCLSGGSYHFGNADEAASCSLANGPIPPPQKERVLLIGWRWKVWPSTPKSHRLPPR